MTYIIIIIALILLFAFIVGTMKVYRFLFTKVYLSHGNIISPSDYAAGSIVPEKINFMSTDGIPANGIFYHCGKNNAPCVIITHGYASKMGAYLDRTKLMLEKGWHVFTFDFRGHGESEYLKTSMGLREYKDLLGALKYVRTRSEINTEKIAIWGNSMGAVSAIKAIAHDSNVTALIADSPFDTLVSNFNYRFKQKKFPLIAVTYMLIVLSFLVRGNMFANSTSKYLSQFNNVPILFIHGDQDLDVEFEASEKLFNLYNGPKEFLRLNAINHYDHDNFPSYLERSISFLKKYLD